MHKQLRLWSAISDSSHALKVGLLYLLSNCLRNTLVAVPQGIDSDSGRKVQVFAILNIVEVASFALFEHGGWAHIGRDHVRELLVDETGCLGCRWRVRRGQRRFYLLID